MHFTENTMEFGKIKSVNTWVEEEYKVHYATKAQVVLGIVYAYILFL